jgi:uncharacterized lipoprotein YmbA
MRGMVLAALLLAGCGGSGEDLTEAELNKEAATLAHDADVAVNRTIKDLQADEVQADLAPKPKNEPVDCR